MVDSDRINKLIAAVPAALALRAGLDLGIFTQLGGTAMTAGSLGAALKVEPHRLS
ncbi:MAG: 16S rRNA methyltransferase, partial [Mesorhizobium sp.]